MGKDIQIRDKIPEEFSSCEEAGEFWDTHDSMDYLDIMTPVEMDARLEGHRFEIQVDKILPFCLKKGLFPSGCRCQSWPINSFVRN